jgi:hypothetical protein
MYIFILNSYQRVVHMVLDTRAGASTKRLTPLGGESCLVLMVLSHLK